jgi:hypothetical protein
MHESVVAGCDVDVVVVVVVVPGAAAGVVEVAVVATVVPFDTVAPAFLLSSRPKINSAARKPTARARAATSHVFEPLRSIAAAR